MKIIKTEKEGLEKLANKLFKKKILKIDFKNFTYIFLLFSMSVFPQLTEKKQIYVIGDVIVSGKTSFSPQTIVTYSGLGKGEKITIPGEKISNAIKKLWGSNLFSSIEVYESKKINDTVFLEIYLVDLPELKKLTITGVKKNKTEDIVRENKLQNGVKVTENLITTTKNYLESTYRKKGFLNAKISIKTEPIIDTISKARVNMFLDISKGSKVKIEEISFIGNDKIKSKTLLKAMKNTKEKNIFRVLKRSKYIKSDFKEDLVSVVDKYKENGYRDARIIVDTLTYDDETNLAKISINLEEGDKYTYGKINYLGNTVYSDSQLNQILKINEGDTYNGVELEKRIADGSDPDADDISNLYQNNGYLFSSVTPVEVSADGNIID